MEFVKYNQLLKICVSYDQDGGYIGFKDFFAESGLEEIDGNRYTYFPDAARWTEEERQEWQDCHERDWDTIQEYLELSGLDRQIVMAYVEVTDNFDPEEAMEAYAGSYTTGAEFAQTLSEELGYIPEDLPSWIAYHIDWQTVWDCELRHDYFESNGHYFRKL